MASRGVVKRWVGDKGYGFILPDLGGNDIFVHAKDLLGVRELAAGDMVTYDAVDDGKGRGKLKATNVRVATSAASNDRFGGIFADLQPGSMLRPKIAGDMADIDFFLEIAGVARDDALEVIAPFILLSSFNCPFLVISDRQVVGSILAPSKAVFRTLLDILDKYIAGCESRGAVMIADFEGEMPGHGGVLTTAQLQWTSTVCPQTLTPDVQSGSRTSTLGLLFGLEQEESIARLRKIMQSSSITKLMWGASGDFQSLLYQELPVPLQVRPVNVVDVKKAFHDLGMARMLEHVPPRFLEGLPSKELIDFDALHSKNKSACALPLQANVAVYAVDDLHRIEAILKYKMPPSESYVAARFATAQMVQELLADPYGMLALQAEMDRFLRRSGAGKTCKAVQITRHIVSLRVRQVELSNEQQTMVDEMEANVQDELEAAGVTILDDLSFST